MMSLCFRVWCLYTRQVTSPAFPQAKGEKELPALLLWTSAFCGHCRRNLKLWVQASRIKSSWYGMFGLDAAAVQMNNSFHFRSLCSWLFLILIKKKIIWICYQCPVSSLKKAGGRHWEGREGEEVCCTSKEFCFPFCIQFRFYGFPCDLPSRIVPLGAEGDDIILRVCSHFGTVLSTHFEFCYAHKMWNLSFLRGRMSHTIQNNVFCGRFTDTCLLVCVWDAERGKLPSHKVSFREPLMLNLCRKPKRLLVLEFVCW